MKQFYDVLISFRMDTLDTRFVGIPCFPELGCAPSKRDSIPNSLPGITEIESGEYRDLWNLMAVTDRAISAAGQAGVLYAEIADGKYAVEQLRGIWGAALKMS